MAKKVTSIDDLPTSDLVQLRKVLMEQQNQGKSEDELKAEDLGSLRKLLAEGSEPSLGDKALKGVAAVGEFVDKFTGAPARTVIGKLQDDITSPIDALSAGASQFGADPKLAPTGKDIASKAGLSTEETIDLPLLGKVSPAGIAGFGVDVVADPLSLIPGVAFTKAGSGIKAGVKAVTGLGKQASVKIARAVTPRTVEAVESVARMIKDKFKPTIAGDAKEFTDLAVKHGVELTDEVKDLIDFDKTSAINRQLRKGAEGVLGEKLNRGVRTAIDEVNQALENFKNKFSPIGEPISEVTAGDVIKEGLTKSKEELLSSLDVTYNTVVKQLDSSIPGKVRVSLVDIDPKLANVFSTKINKIKNEAEKILQFGGKRRKQEATEIIDFIENLESTSGDLGAMALQLREVGEDAFGKVILGQPSVNVRLSRDLYGVISDSLVDATRSGLGDDAAESLLANNKALSKFFTDESPIVRALRSDPSPEKLYKKLVLNGDTKTIQSLKEVLSPEELGALKNAFIDSISPKSIDQNVSYKTIFNNLKRNKKNIVAELFEPDELEELLDILRLGDRLNLPFMSLSGTGGSNSFKSVLKSIPEEIFNGKILESLKKTARGTASDKTDELVNAAKKGFNRSNLPPIIGGRTSGLRKGAKAAQLTSQQETNRQTPIERRVQLRGGL